VSNPGLTVVLILDDLQIFRARWRRTIRAVTQNPAFAALCIDDALGLLQWVVEGDGGF
jgi:hypothetical protein